MTWERAIVVYPRVRDVFIDGHRVGQTNELLRVRRGQQDFDLGMPADYRPSTQRVSIANTSAIRPAIIVFEPTSHT